MGNCGNICTNALSNFKGDIIMDRLIIEDNYNKKDKMKSVDIQKIKYLQKKIKQFLKSKHISYNYINKPKQQNKISQIEDSDNNLVLMYNSNLQNKLTSAKSQTFKNSSNNHNESSHKEKYSKQSPYPKNRSKHGKSGKSSIISEKISSNNNNLGSELDEQENLNNKEKEKIKVEKEKKENKENKEQKENKEDKRKKENKEEKEYKANKEEIDSNSLDIQILKADLLDKNIFENDAFNKGLRNTKNENDPRDNKNDNIRKKYPKIIEGEYVYIGEWKNGLRDGLGSLFLEKEIKFTGYFSENKINGYGHLWKEDGDSYQGYWKDFKAEGFGIYKSNNGACYDGEWVGDLQCGFGIEQWPRGSTYFGDYINGYKNGIGVLNFGNKAWYEGEFKNGIMSGIGSFFFEDGRRYLGMWKNNKMNGYGYIIWPNENLYKGEFKDDKKEGFGICKIKKKVFMGMWRDNKLEGNVIIVDDGKLKKQYWSNGKASKNLSNDIFISFEKFAKKYIKNTKHKN